MTPSATDQLLIMYGILLRHLFFLCCSSCVQSVVGFFYMIDVNIFVSELNNAYFFQRNILKQFVAK